jgi:glycine dehydrogenase subunit 1
MLETIGVDDIAGLFEPIPEQFRLRGSLDLPPSMSEPELMGHLRGLAETGGGESLTCFAGGGAYDHHVPAAVRALSGRAEFATSYTPYQPELSQGVLQALYEFQTVVCEIYGMDVANASLYDGANALVEGVNLAVRTTGRRRVLVSEAVHPHYTAVLKTYTSGLDLDFVRLRVGPAGVTEWSDVDARDAAAVVAGYPNFLGGLEDVEAAAAAAHDGGGLCVAVTDPTAMGVLRPPGACGADVAVGEGQSLGNAIAYGGPGRISGGTADADGRRAYVLTLQAREQHIRRARATSNVCTNQTLMALTAAIHLCWLGPGGLRRLGELCVRRTAHAAGVLGDIPGCSIRFPGPRFKELVLDTPMPGERLVRGLARRGYLAGPALGRWYPRLPNSVLVAVTENRTEEDIALLGEAVEKELAER